MPSNKMLELAKKIVIRDRAMFQTLMEFEETKKIRTKVRMNFTIDKSIASRFKKYCRRNGFNMSRKIEKAMDEISQ
jgi:hypothetical protein